MNVKKIVLLFGALVIAVITAVMAKNMFAGAGSTARLRLRRRFRSGPKVLVARKALPVGTIIDAESLAYQPWPKELIQSAYYTEGDAGLRHDQAAWHGRALSGHGRPAADPWRARRPERSRLPRRGAWPGHARRHGSGERLDRRCRLRVPGRPRRHRAHPGKSQGGGEGPPLKVSETIVRNVRVLATDQRIDSKGEDGKTEVKTFSNVTIEVTPRIAEKVAVAQSMGSLSLSLRSIADNTAELERAVASGEVKRAGRHQPGRGAPDAAGGRQSPDGHQHHLYHGWRRVALPAPHRSGAAHPMPMPMRHPQTALASLRVGRWSTLARSCASLAAILSPSFRWEHAKMTSRNITRRARLGTALAALAIGLAHGCRLRLPHWRSTPLPGRRKRSTSARARAPWCGCPRR